MADLIDTLAISASGMRAQATRLKHVSENLANADTPGYRRKTISFETSHGSSDLQTVHTGPVRLDPTDLQRIYDPSHPLADDTGHYEGSNVQMIFEVADSREAQRSYEANLRMFDQARKMTTAALDLLRR